MERMLLEVMTWDVAWTGWRVRLGGGVWLIGGGGPGMGPLARSERESGGCGVGVREPGAC